MKNHKDTLLAQYANSPTITEIVDRLNDWIAPEADIDSFYKNIWNIETADDAGLEIWGRIVGVSRFLEVDAQPAYFGFSQQKTNTTADDATPQPLSAGGVFYAGELVTTTYRLSKDAFRQLIMVKAMLNICKSTIPSINNLLLYLFSGRGRSYVQDTGDMQIRYVFEFVLSPVEMAIVLRSGAFPRPSGVNMRIIQYDSATTFGFAQANLQTFGSGSFFTS